ncbi:MAG: xanthine dehydrogenase, partial [Firmicutes bacterium]|nr:xanthine dehydrogenase [Bacillota bacterium]
MNKNHYSVVGKSIKKLDGISLVTGAAKFTDDFEMRGMLYGKILFSPHAHARIKSINTEKAKSVPGVHAVITYKDISRVPFTTAGQGHPEPSPYDTYTLDSKVRFIGDRVAGVAAETPEIAGKAIELIEVDYELLPAILDPEKAMEPGAPVIHDEKDSSGIFDASKNLVAHVKAWAWG